METGWRRSPTRREVEQKWEALIDGSLSRADVHAWASLWIDGPYGFPEDIMITNALQQLHGFDIAADPEDGDRMKHGAGGRHMHSGRYISEAYAEWKRNCILYDRDPAEYRRKAVARARMIVARDQN